MAAEDLMTHNLFLTTLIYFSVSVGRSSVSTSDDAVCLVMHSAWNK